MSYENLASLPGKLKFSFNGQLATRYDGNKAYSYELTNNGWELVDSFTTN